jgi:2-polyprenyl-3-methyl-5-hydroxy-6-metoxy-1,4-benzoquinol methylase
MASPQKMPPSPVTGSDNVALVDTFSTADIIRLYREQENVDVAGYFRGLDEIYLFECRDTGYKFYFPFETAGGAEFYQALGEENEKRGVEYDRDWAEDHQFALPHVNEGDRVLEVGCNIGTFLERVLKVTPHTRGLDFNALAVAKAKERGVDAVNESIEQHAETHNDQYDVVCAFQVFEHLTQIRLALTAMLNVLKPGGKLMLGVPNNEPFFQRFNKYEVMNMPPHHVGLWNVGAFKKLEEYFDVELVDHRYYGTRGVLVDAYLRAKLMTDVRSLPRRHTAGEKLKMMLAAGVTVPLSVYDHALRGIRNHANLFVVFRKK